MANDPIHRDQQDASAIVGATEPPGLLPFTLTEFNTLVPAQPGKSQPNRDGKYDVRIQLGRAYLQGGDVSKLSDGSVIALDRRVSDPVDVFVSGRLLARGELLAVGENFGLRITELIVAEPESRAA